MESPNRGGLLDFIRSSQEEKCLDVDEDGYFDIEVSVDFGRPQLTHHYKRDGCKTISETLSVDAPNFTTEKVKTLAAEHVFDEKSKKMSRQFKPNSRLSFDEETGTYLPPQNTLLRALKREKQILDSIQQSKSKRKKSAENSKNRKQNSKSKKIKSNPESQEKAQRKLKDSKQ